MPKHKRPDAEAKKAAIYIRVSTKWQAEDGDSLPMQREELPKYVQYALGIKEYEIFEDAGFSAKNTDRPDYQRMMARVREGEFTHIVVWKLDRISRNLLDFAGMYAELKTLGVVFISKNEQFDTSTAIGEAMLKIILVFAELERNMTSERVAATLISRAQGGQWNGGRIPFGYDHVKGSEEFTINESEAATVRLIYDLYEKNRSLLKVATYLNEHEYKTRSGIPWNPTTVHTILTSPFYIGTYRYNRFKEGSKTFTRRSESEWIMVPDHHPHIIEADRQRAVAQILSENDRASSFHKTYERKNIHIFAGLIFCGSCGSQFQANVDRARAGGWRPSIYLCSRHRRFKDCENKYVSDITLGPFILNFISNYIRAQRNFGKTTDAATLEKKLLRGDFFQGVSIDPESVEDIRLSFRASRFGDQPYQPRQALGDADLPSEREMLESERRRLERALQRLKTLYLYSDEAMPEKDFAEESTSLNDKLGKVNQRLSELIVQEQEDDDLEAADEHFMEQASFLVITEELLSRRYVNYEKVIRILDKRTLKLFLNSIIQKIVIFQGKTRELTFKNGIVVKFLYSDPPESEKEKAPEIL